MNTLLLIDGNPLMHRAFHALPPFKTKMGLPTNAVFGFFSILNKTITDFKPKYLTVCFDTPAPTFRKKFFKDYQAQRPKIKDELAHQFPLVKEGLVAAHVTFLEKEGYEADDLIGTISNKSKRADMQILILSADRDILQLVDKQVFVITPQIGNIKMTIYDEKTVINKFGVTPKQIPDLKALVGDPSDNYHGAKGIGPKTAAKLLNQFSCLNELFANLDKLDKKTKEILKANKENIFLSYQLAKIVTDVKIKFDLEKARFNGFDKNLKDFLLKYEIKSLAKKFFPDKTNKTEKEKLSLKDEQIQLF